MLVCIFYLLLCSNDLNELDSDKVYLSKDKTESSSLTWINLNENQPLFSISLEYIHSYYLHSSEINYPNLDINILAKGDELKPYYILILKVCIQKGKKTNKSNYQENIELIPCNYNYGIIFCSIKNINKNTDEVFILSEESTSINIIEWSNPGNYTYDTTIYYNLKYINLIYCFYDSDKKYYIYSLKNENDIKKGQYFEIDLYTNDVNTYGLCLNKENKDGITECHIPIIEQKDDHIIKIKNGRKYGNTQLTGFPNDFIINQNSIIVISKAYDLQFKNNNWEF